MSYLVALLVYGVGTTMHPLVAAGHLAVGALLRRWWIVALACVGWAAAVTGMDALLTPQALSPDLVFAIASRAVAGLLLGSVVYAIALVVRRLRRRPA